jgi:DNA-binding transcriptional regulator PaaX
MILKPLASEQRRLVSVLSERLKQIAESLDIPAEVLMPKADLEHLVREQMNPSLAAPENWSGWRADTVVVPLRQSLKERAAS